MTVVCSSVDDGSSFHTPSSVTTCNSCTRATLVSMPQSAGPGRQCSGRLSTVILKEKFVVVCWCDPCNALKPHQPKEPLQLHDIPHLPWSLTAADVFEWDGKEHLVIVDSYSGWFEIDRLPGTTSVALCYCRSATATHDRRCCLLHK